MYDKIEKIGSSLVQHGKYNDRIYVMYLNPNDVIKLPEKLVNLAREKKYSKICAKVPSNATHYFQTHNFFKEAFVPDFYDAKLGMYCMAKFLNHRRKLVPEEEWKQIRNCIKIAKEKKNRAKLNSDIVIKKLKENNIEYLTTLYGRVFSSYPFPIYDSDYIKRTMNSNIYYFGLFHERRLVAASSAEIDFKNGNAEMTDFATHPDFRGKNYSLLLLQEMEREMLRLNIRTLYSIARSLSHAMNITFSKSGYIFSGTLKNNTNIAGRIESMNVWYKIIER